MDVNELFERCVEIGETQRKAPGANINRMMHETLVMACHEGVKGTGQSFGNLFAQVDYLCRLHSIAMADRMAIQTMRRHSNWNETFSEEEVMYDLRALCLFISAIFQKAIPQYLTGILPHTYLPYRKDGKINYSYIRCIVRKWNDGTFTAAIDQEGVEETIAVDYTSEHLRYLKEVLQEGMQLNLLDCSVATNTPAESPMRIVPSIVVVEPDFLIDISALAACFESYGHHPLNYTVRRMSPPANSQAILLGHFAGHALDDIVNDTTHYDVRTTIRNHFKRKAMEFCTCPDFIPNTFLNAAASQAANIQQAVDVLFESGELVFDRKKAILEPSFVCERLGVQGRVDLMTTDFRLLVEQKSGKNYCIERHCPDAHGSMMPEPHYVQLLLYYGVLRYNFDLGLDTVNMRLLYSKYVAGKGLVVVNFLRDLFREAICLRNLIVQWELHTARHGFKSVIDMITPDTVNTNKAADKFFTTWKLPFLQSICHPLHHLPPLEKAYLCAMLTFVYREQRVSKLGVQEGVSSCASDLWTMPLSEKRDTGNIFTSLRIKKKEQSNAQSGYNLIGLTVPEQGEDFLPNFRTGDMIYLYAYNEKEEPDVRRHILYKGTLVEMHTDSLVVALNDGQQNPDILDSTFLYAVEHASADVSTTGGIRALHTFITAPKERKDLLLAQRVPQRNPSVVLTRSYHPSYDEVLHKAKQANDYYLLIGPPGTGKTSMALRYMVEEELKNESSCLLLMSYTNRAVDEICTMLADANLDFIRLGSEYRCAPRFKKYLMGNAIDDSPRLDAIQERLRKMRIVVGTTSTMTGRTDIFSLKHFSLAIIDEASQILEPDIIGLLSAHVQDKGLSRCAIDKFILIGDHKQLPAVVQQDEQDSETNHPLLHDIGLTNCRNSLFERLVNTEYRSGRTHFIGILRQQGRMHPDIAAFPNRMFYAKEQLEPVPLPHQVENSLDYALYSQDATDDLLKAHRMIFIPSSLPVHPDVSDKVNTHEAQIVSDLLRRIHRFYGKRFDTEKTVGVIVPYRNQISMIRKEVERLNIPELLDVSIDTVERYQGSQRDVIIYSFTIHHSYQLDFLTAHCFEEDGLTIDRKLNVAITRARKQLILTGNRQVLSKNKIFRELIFHIEQKTKTA